MGKMRFYTQQPESAAHGKRILMEGSFYSQAALKLSVPEYYDQSSSLSGFILEREYIKQRRHFAG